MSTLYRTVGGETFDVVARRAYGDELLAYQLQEANPGLTEPMPPGLPLVVPDQPDFRRVPPDLSPNETGIRIEGKRFGFWESVRIRRSVDAMDTIEFSAPFEADDTEFRNTFAPLSFKPCSYYSGGSPLFTGTLLNVTPQIDKNRKTVQVGGYSLPGILNDCTPPPAQFPKLEWDDATLDQIVAPLVRPFGLGLLILNDVGAPFERVAIEPGKKILPFVVELARERGLIVSSSSDGFLTLAKSAEAGRPVGTLRQGESPLAAVLPTFNPQEYYSSLTGREPVLFGFGGGDYTVRNERLRDVFRPYTFNAEDTENADVPQLVDAKAGRMFANVASYVVEVATWDDPTGARWRPNTTVKLQAPDAMVYEPYEFLIRAVDYVRTRDAETATLELVMPESFRGEIPERMPWES